MNTLAPEVIHQAHLGSQKAFTQLVETYQRPVYNLCYRMLGDSDEAEDAAQETFLRAYKNIHKYNIDRPISTWLLSIAAHFCIDQLRKKRMVMISIDQSPYLDPPDSSPSPEARTFNKDEQKRVQALLRTLNPHDRAAIVMYYWYDFSYDEIAHSLSLTPSAVKSRLHRARMSMANTWSDQKGAQALPERNPNESSAF